MASKLEFSADGKALDYFEVAPFAIDLTPATIVEAAASLPNPPSDADDAAGDSWRGASLAPAANTRP